MTDETKSITAPEGYDDSDPCCAALKWHCAGFSCCACAVNECKKGVIFKVASLKDAMAEAMKEAIEESK